jgi:hypothetical protein
MGDDYVGTEADKKLLLLAKEFFTDDQPPSVPPSIPPRVRRSRAMPPEVKALKHFCRRMDDADRNERVAAIRYLADRYLGWKI